MYRLSQGKATDRSGKVVWLLCELEVPYEIEVVKDKGSSASLDYRAVHPLGKVPALYFSNGSTLFESGAICLHLADVHSEKQMNFPEGSMEKAQVMQWVFYNCTTLDPKLFEWWYVDDDAPDAEHTRKQLMQQLFDMLSPLEKILSDSQYLVGDRFSVADIVIGQTLAWMLRKPPILEPFPSLRQYCQRLKSRPAAVKSLVFQGV